MHADADSGLGPKRGNRPGGRVGFRGFAQRGALATSADWTKGSPNQWVSLSNFGGSCYLNKHYISYPSVIYQAAMIDTFYLFHR
jgi:hypothetical protein